MPEPMIPSHCTLLQAGEIQAIVGDASRDGMGGPQYCGLWSLTSKHWPFNAFGNSCAGLIPGEVRGRSPALEQVDDTTCVLRREPDETRPVRSRAEYAVRQPHCIDHELTVTDEEDVRQAGCGFREVSWCSYINCPDDPRLHFLSNGEWHRYISPRHGLGANIAPGYMLDGELEDWPLKGEWISGRKNDRPFHWDRYERRFDQPFYYTRLGVMVMIVVFDTPRWLRFFCSPTGGGESLIPGRSCPAWDFEWVIPESKYEVGRDYAFRMRLIYKRFVSDDDVLEEVRRTQSELGFEEAPAI